MSPTDAAPEDARELKEIVELVFQLVGRLRAFYADVAVAADLTPQQGRALHLLGTPVSMRDMAALLHCDASNVTGIIDRLAERGLVRRQPDPADRRRKLLVLTPAGEDLRATLRREVLAAHPVAHGLAPAERQQLRALLTRVLDASPVAAAEG